MPAKVRDEPSWDAVATDGAATDPTIDGALAAARRAPALLLAWSPESAASVDRMRLGGRLRVGRSHSATWTVADSRLSKLHFEIEGAKPAIRDLLSTNGTFVNGRRLGGPRPLADGDVVRAGRCAFVFVAAAGDVFPATRADARIHGLAGRFHSPAMVAAVERAVRTNRHLLVEGESGVGKELVARAVHRIACPRGPFVAHNCARFASVEEAETTIFGVARGVFSGVDARPGLIEQADGGVLYLDEILNLPVRLQRSLLRFAEDGQFARIGETRSRPARVRLLFGSNQAVDDAVAEGTLAHDLVARTHRLAVPPLSRRRADIPDIFLAALGRAFERAGIGESEWRECVTADYLEALMLHDLSKGNVRMLEDFAATAAAGVSEVEPDERRVEFARSMVEFLPESPVLARYASGDGRSEVPEFRRGSPYEIHREAIIKAYRDLGGSLSAVESELRSRGIVVHRRWLSEYLERWGIRHRRRKGPGGIRDSWRERE